LRDDAGLSSSALAAKGPVRQDRLEGRPRYRRNASRTRAQPALIASIAADVEPCIGEDLVERPRLLGRDVEALCSLIGPGDGEQPLLAAEQVLRGNRESAIGRGRSRTDKSCNGRNVSARKRRTILELATSMVVVLVVERRLAIAEGSSIVDGVRPENQSAARAVVDQVLGSVFRYTDGFLLIVAVVLTVALVLGPYPWARETRRWVADLGRTVGGAVHGDVSTDATAWVTAHRDVDARRRGARLRSLSCSQTYRCGVSSCSPSSLGSTSSRSTA
jgi:hypothetical protein